MFRLRDNDEKGEKDFWVYPNQIKAIHPPLQFFFLVNVFLSISLFIYLMVISMLTFNQSLRLWWVWFQFPLNLKGEISTGALSREELWEKEECLREKAQRWKKRTWLLGWLVSTLSRSNPFLFLPLVKPILLLMGSDWIFM